MAMLQGREFSCKAQKRDRNKTKTANAAQIKDLTETTKVKSASYPPLKNHHQVMVKFLHEVS